MSSLFITSVNNAIDSIILQQVKRAIKDGKDLWILYEIRTACEFMQDHFLEHGEEEQGTSSENTLPQCQC
jgi:hypothetical protein